MNNLGCLSFDQYHKTLCSNLNCLVLSDLYFCACYLIRLEVF